MPPELKQQWITPKPVKCDEEGVFQLPIDSLRELVAQLTGTALSVDTRIEVGYVSCSHFNPVLFVPPGDVTWVRVRVPKPEQ